MRPDSAMILAAGLGLRMRPLTNDLPKPLVRVAEAPLIEYSFNLLENIKIQNIVINSSYLSERLESYLRHRHGVPIVVSHEPERLETGGGVAKALPLLGKKPFYVMNSDAILLDGARPALLRLADAWDDAAMDALLLLMPREAAFGYDGAGDFFYENGALRRRGDAAEAPYIFTGTQILHPRLFTGCPEGAFSLNVLYDQHRDVQGRLPRIGAVIHDGEWLHVGTPDAIAGAEARLHAHSRLPAESESIISNASFAEANVPR